MLSRWPMTFSCQCRSLWPKNWRFWTRSTHGMVTCVSFLVHVSFIVQSSVQVPRMWPKSSPRLRRAGWGIEVWLGSQNLWTSVSNNLFVHLTAHQCEVSINGREEYQATSVLGDEELWQMSRYSSWSRSLYPKSLHGIYIPHVTVVCTF